MNQALPMTPASRIILLATGAAWTARSLLSFAELQYTDPETALDWTAVWLYTAAWLLLAAAILLIACLASGRGLFAIASVVAVAALIAGIANALEDAFGMKALGGVYLIAFLTAWLGLLALAVAWLLAHYPRLACIGVLLFAGVSLFPLGGGVLVLAATGAIALAPRWFAPRPTSVAAPANASA